MSDLIKLKAISSENDMRIFAQDLAKICQIGDVFLLDGDLGSGKSFFSRCFIKYLSLKQLNQEIEVPSPTFTLVQLYDHLIPPIWHFDLYRLSNSDEAYELGLDDAVKEGICLIEWPSRLEDDLPNNCLKIFFKHDGLESRNLEVMLNSRWALRLAHLF